MLKVEHSFLESCFVMLKVVHDEFVTSYGYIDGHAVIRLVAWLDGKTAITSRFAYFTLGFF